MNFQERAKLLAHASTTATKIYTHPNFDLAMQYLNQVPQYGEKCDQLKMTKQKSNATKQQTKKPSVQRAN